MKIFDNVMFIQKVFLINEQRQILVIKRKNTEMYKGSWDIPGGRLENTETLSDALIRELKEETGMDLKRLIITISSSKFIGKAVGNPNIFRNFYLCIASGNITLSSEHSEYRWVDYKDLQGIDFPQDPDFQQALKQLQTVLPVINPELSYAVLK